MQSMSATTFFVLYPELANYIMSVLKNAVSSINSSHMQSPTPHHIHAVEASAHATEVSEVGDTCHMAETHSESENVVPAVSSLLLFPVLSLLCRLSPGLEVTDEGHK